MSDPDTVEYLHTAIVAKNAENISIMLTNLEHHITVRRKGKTQAQRIKLYEQSIQLCTILKRSLLYTYETDVGNAKKRQIDDLSKLAYGEWNKLNLIASGACGGAVGAGVGALFGNSVEIIVSMGVLGFAVALGVACVYVCVNHTQQLKPFREEQLKIEAVLRAPIDYGAMLELCKQFEEKEFAEKLDEIRKQVYNVFGMVEEDVAKARVSPDSGDYQESQDASEARNGTVHT